MVRLLHPSRANLWKRVGPESVQKAEEGKWRLLGVKKVISRGGMTPRHRRFPSQLGLSGFEPPRVPRPLPLTMVSPPTGL